MKKTHRETFASKPTMLGAALTLLLGFPFAFANCVFADPTPEFAYVANQGDSTISGYIIDSSTGALREITGSPFATDGFEVRSVAVDPSGRFAYGANLCISNSHCPRGTVSAYTIDSSTGALTAVPGSPFLAGRDPASVTVDPSGRFAYVVNQCIFCSRGSVSAYTINASTGALKEIAGSPFAADVDPRVVTVDPSGQSAYVTNYFGRNVSAFTINTSTGALSKTAGSPFAVVNLPTSVTVDPSGRFAYVTNECYVTRCGKGSVSAYTIDSSTGVLRPIAGSPFASGGKPSSVKVDPSGRFAYVANQYGPTVWAYAINSSTGTLKEIAGSPFASASGSNSLAVDPSGRFVYVTSFPEGGCSPPCPPGEVSAFTINSSTGALKAVAGAPFAAGTFAVSVAIAAPAHTTSVLTSPLARSP